MVFDMHRSNKKKANPKANKAKASRCKSADSGVSVALNNAFNKGYSVIKSESNVINDLEEEQLDFEPEFEDHVEKELQNSTHMQPKLNESQSRNVSDESIAKEFSLEEYEDDSCSASNISIAHARDMLPIPHSDAEDGRQNQYLPLYYTPSSRTNLDSSSDDDSVSEAEQDSYSDLQDSNFTVDPNVSQSGYEEDEDSSSVYSITQEEENMLLESEEEESPQPPASPVTHLPLIIQSDAVETCQIGNARITLPKFINNSYPVQNSDLKRNKSSASLRALERQKKKKKWDLPFKPERPHTQVFLEDIGYVSENEVASTRGSTDGGNTVPKLIVTCDKNKITCEELQGDAQRGQNSVAQIDDATFKMPPLPPPIRPPTRLKRLVSNSNHGSVSNLQIKVSNKGNDSPREQHRFTRFSSSERSSLNDDLIRETAMDKDDALSILASTIEGDGNDVANINDTTFLDDEDQSENYEAANSVEDRVKEWVQNISTPTIFNSIAAQPPSIIQASPPKNTIEGMTVMPPAAPKGNLRLNFKDIPNIFNGLCFFYYFNESCVRPHCNLPHTVAPNRLIFKLRVRSPEEVYKAFQLSMRFERLFRESYPTFITAFGLLKMHNELIASIKHFLTTNTVDPSEAIELVVTALEESGLSFQEAIEMISFNIGFLEHPVLADILLDLITRKYNISENWEVIKRIVRARGKISPIVAKKLLTRAVMSYPLNKELCLDIYNVFIKNNTTDVSQISEEILTPYKTLAGFRDTAAQIPKNSAATSPTKPPMPSLVAVPNNREMLAAHIDNSLCKERERYERAIQESTLSMSFSSPAETQFSTRTFNNGYAMQQASLLENGRSSSDSDDRPIFPARPQPFPRADFPISGGNNYAAAFSVDSPSTSTSTLDLGNINPDIALNYQPPSDISEYVPEIVKKGVSPTESEVTLTPSRPIFGKPSYRNGFSFKNSLHNLLPDIKEHVNINEKDVAKLDTVIKTRNGFEFYKLLEYYKGLPTIENFITMTIAHLKSSGTDIYNNLVQLIKSLELAKPDYAQDKTIKAIIEVVVMNLLLEFQKKGLWTYAKDLLEKFRDWDSLVSSKIFAKTKITHMGRYIFLAKIFAMAKSFHFAYEILLCPNLKLLGPPDNWPYFRNSMADLESRNAVLREFLKYGHLNYIIEVTDLYRRNYKFGGIYGFDVHSFFNPMLISMINEQQTALLKYFYNDIDIYYKIMDVNVLRAFVILLADQFGQEILFRLYEMCCERHIYTLFTGSEKMITLRVNMFDLEIQLILNYYFYKLSEKLQVPASNLFIQIKLMENTPLYPKMLQRCVRSIKEVNERVKKILRDNFRITVNETPAKQLTIIEILNTDLIKWVQCNQRYFPVL